MSVKFKNVKVEERFGAISFKQDECARISFTWEDRRGENHMLEIYEGTYKDGICIAATGPGKQLIVSPISSNVICVKTGE